MTSQSAELVSRVRNIPCQLAEHKQCCCTCRWRLSDFYHCTTVDDRHGACVCSVPKGFICAAPEMERAHSGWSEHGLCEMHVAKTESPDASR